MSQRFYISGAIDAALNESGATGGTTALMGTHAATIPTGRAAVYLTDFWVYNSHASQNALVSLHDEAEAATGAATSQRYTLYVPYGNTAHVTFDSPLIFQTACAAVLGATGGTVSIGDCGGSGYEK